MTKILLQIFLMILSFIIPKDNKNILLSGGEGNKFNGNPRALIKELKKIEGKRLFWITKNLKLRKEIVNEGVNFIYLYSIKGFIKILRSKIIISDHGPSDYSYFKAIIGNFNIIQTWHGSPIKNIWLDAISNPKGVYKKRLSTSYYKIFKRLKLFPYQNEKLILASSPFIKKILEGASGNKNIKVTGYPRNDILNENKNKLFSNYKKVILYLPTFRMNSIQKFNDKFIEELNLYLKEKNYIFIIKNHPYQKSFIIKNKSNIKYIDKDKDPQELLAESDILISDYSSAIFDFVIQNKPIILYPYDYLKYISEERGLYIDYFNDLPGPFAKNETELVKEIKTINNTFKNKLYQKKYTAFNKKFNTYSNNFSKRVIIELKKWL